MNRTTKILLVTFAVLLTTFGGLLFFAHQKLKDLDLKKLAKESVEKAMPETTLDIGALDYSLGASVKFAVGDIQLKLKKDNSQLLKVKELFAKIPLWAIIVDGGSISIEVNSPIVSFVQYNEKQSNWQLATGKGEKEGTVRVPQSVNEKTKIEIPSFLAKSNVDIKFNDTLIDYRLASKSEGKVTVSKFIIKNLNLREDTAFELASQLGMKNAEGKTINCEALAIGQLNIHEFIQDHPLKGKIVLTLNNLQAPYFTNTLSDLVTHIELEMTPQMTQMGIDSRLAKLASVKMKVEQTQDLVEVKDINTEADIEELMKLAGQQRPDLKTEGAKLQLTGQVKIPAEGKGNMAPNLSFAISPEMTYLAPQNIEAKVSMEGKLTGGDFDILAKVKLLSGEVTTTIKNSIDLNNPPKSASAMNPFKIDVLMSGLNLSTAFIQDFMYAAPTGKTSLNKPSVKTRYPSQSEEVASLVPATIKLKGERLKVGDADFGFIGNVDMNGISIKSDGIDFHLGQGKGKVSFNTTMLPKQFKSSQFQFGLTQLNLSSLKAFLPPRIEALHGTFNGQMSGTVKNGPLPENLEYSVKTDVSAKDGKISGLNLTDKIKSVLTSVPLLKDKWGGQEIKVEDDFDILEFKGLLAQNLIQIDSFKFTGIKNSSSVTGSGTVSPPPVNGTSEFTGIYKDLTGKISSILKKHVGTEEIPIKLKGKGYDLMPEIGYTLEKLLKSAFKNNEKVQEVKKKVEEKVKEEIKSKAEGKVKDLIENNKEGINKVFKGLFK